MPLQTAYQLYFGRDKLTFVKPMKYYLKQMIEIKINCNRSNQNYELPDGTQRNKYSFCHS